MKPKQVTLYETTSGETVKTLDEWKFSELLALLGCDASDAPSELKTNCKTWVSRMIADAEQVVEILSVKE